VNTGALFIGFGVQRQKPIEQPIALSRDPPS